MSRAEESRSRTSAGKFVDSFTTPAFAACRAVQHKLSASEFKSGTRSSLDRPPPVGQRAVEPENGRRSKKWAMAEDVDRGCADPRVLRKCRTKALAPGKHTHLHVAGGGPK